MKDNVNLKILLDHNHHTWIKLHRESSTKCLHRGWLGVVINQSYRPAVNISKQLWTSHNSWEHRKTSLEHLKTPEITLKAREKPSTLRPQSCGGDRLLQTRPFLHHLTVTTINKKVSRFILPWIIWDDWFNSRRRIFVQKESNLGHLQTLFANWQSALGRDVSLICNS